MRRYFELCHDFYDVSIMQEIRHSEPEFSGGEESRCLLRNEILPFGQDDILSALRKFVPVLDGTAHVTLSRRPRVSFLACETRFFGLRPQNDMNAVTRITLGGVQVTELEDGIVAEAGGVRLVVTDHHRPFG